MSAELRGILIVKLPLGVARQHTASESLDKNRRRRGEDIPVLTI